MSELQKLLIDVFTLVACACGILIGASVLMKGKLMEVEAGISFKIYLTLVGITEVFYVMGAVLIISAMGVNILHHLAKLELLTFCRMVKKFDMKTVQVIGMMGWIGFIINRSVSFLSPGYLLFSGGRRLPRYLFYSAWTEVCLECIITALLFMALKVR